MSETNAPRSTSAPTHTVNVYTEGWTNYAVVVYGQPLAACTRCAAIVPMYCYSPTGQLIDGRALHDAWHGEQR